jgi:2-C-methyl-D-erythritol 2,4-cyclodiphosphate synthase
MTNVAMPRVGNGFDVHALVAGRRLVLGGVTVPFDRGLAGHSDADVLIHAICDAILGAIGAVTSADTSGYRPGVQGCRQPHPAAARLATRAVAGFGSAMSMQRSSRRRLAGTVYPADGRQHRRRSRRGDRAGQREATTTEGLGFAGRGEGIAAMATVLVFKSGN